MEDNQTKLNIAGAREPMSANGRGAVQLSKPQCCLLLWGGVASEFLQLPWQSWGAVLAGLGRKVGLAVLSRTAYLPPEENP